MDDSDVGELFEEPGGRISWRAFLVVAVLGAIVVGLFWWNSPERRLAQALEVEEPEYVLLASSGELEEVWIGLTHVTARLKNSILRDGKTYDTVKVRATFASVDANLEKWAPQLPTSKVHIAK